jgi:hypothetical protein
MVTVETTKAIPSKAFEGVEIVVRESTADRHVKLQLETAEHVKKLRELQAEARRIDGEPQERRDVMRKLAIEDEVAMLLTKDLYPARIKWGVAAVKNLQIGNEEATLDNIMHWPLPFFGEVLAIVHRMMGLGEEEKNSPSLTTSGAPADGQANSTTAVVVN